MDMCKTNSSLSALGERCRGAGAVLARKVWEHGEDKASREKREAGLTFGDDNMEVTARRCLREWVWSRR
eukprot:364596-Chlamydomonas_euryale.AAC.6